MVEMDREIEISKKPGLAAEVINFVKNGTLLKVSGRASSGGEIISDLKAAKRYAWDEVYGDEEFTWVYLRSEKISEIWNVICNDESKYSEVDSKLSGI